MYLLLLVAPDMILVHQRVDTGDKNWGCITLDLSETRLSFVQYSGCGSLEGNPSFSSIYDAAEDQNAIAADFNVCITICYSFYALFLH